MGIGRVVCRVITTLIMLFLREASVDGWYPTSRYVIQFPEFTYSKNQLLQVLLDDHILNRCHGDFEKISIGGVCEM